MIQIIPKIRCNLDCPACGTALVGKDLVFQGIHVCFKSECINCKRNFVADLPIGHSKFAQYIVDVKNWKIYGGNKGSDSWYGKPFMDSLKRPTEDKINLAVKVHKKYKKVVLLNCIDYLYGHSLLKLLNSQKILENKKNLGVILLIPKTLAWMVPEGIAEVWEVDVPPGKARLYYKDLDKKIARELTRFDTVYISHARSHPSKFNIERFTGVTPHDFRGSRFRFTFIWREDRPWVTSDYVAYLARRLKLGFLVLLLQKYKVIFCLWLVKRRLPNAQPTIAGLGKSYRFPKWITDIRFAKPNFSQENKLCSVYSESRVVFGVHGSNMLLPSAHAGATIDLLPSSRLGNYAQDILYQTKEKDYRLISYLYRYLPIGVSVRTIAKQIYSLIEGYPKAIRYFNK